MSNEEANTGELSEEFEATTAVEEETKRRSALARMLRLNDPDGHIEDEVTQALKKGDFRRVQELTDAILEQDPENVEARIDKAFAFAMEGDFEESMRLNLEALELDPENTCAMNNLGCDYADLGRNEEALEIFMKAHELDPTDTLVLSNIAYTLQDLERPEEAVKYTGILKELGINIAATAAGHVAGDAIAGAITDEPEVAEAAIGALDLISGPV